MKTLTFEKKEMIEPLAISKDEAVRFTRDGNVRILLNGIATHIISSREIVRYNSDTILKCIQSVLNEVVCNDNGFYELAFDGENSISITETGDKYVIKLYKTSPIYKNE